LSDHQVPMALAQRHAKPQARPPARQARRPAEAPPPPPPRPSPPPSRARPPSALTTPTRRPPRRVIAARRLLSAFGTGGAVDDGLAPYLWRCPLVAEPPESWRRLERAAARGLPARALLPLLAAPPASLLPEGALLLPPPPSSPSPLLSPSPPPACQLSRRGLLAPLLNRELEVFVARLFEAAVVGRRGGGAGDGDPAATATTTTAAAPRAVAAAAPLPRLPPPPPEVCLSLHDLFHAHLFLSRGGGAHGDVSAGLLFHAAEYPRRQQAEARGGGNGDGGDDDDDEFAFPHDLGRCQRGSPLVATRASLDWRSTLYFRGSMAAFSVAGGGPLRPLLRPGTAPLRTVYEEDLSLCFSEEGAAGVGGAPPGALGPDVLCFAARDVRPSGLARHPLWRPPPPPVDTSLGPLHVFVSY